MTEHYKINLDYEKRLMQVRLFGFWNSDVIADFIRDIEIEEKRLLVGQRPYFVLSDLREFPVQSRDIVDEMEKHLAAWSNTGSFSAIVTPSALAQMQFKRIAEGGNRKFFTIIEDANAWLVTNGMSLDRLRY